MLHRNLEECDEEMGNERFPPLLAARLLPSHFWRKEESLGKVLVMKGAGSATCQSHSNLLSWVAIHTNLCIRDLLEGRRIWMKRNETNRNEPTTSFCYPR